MSIDKNLQFKLFKELYTRQRKWIFLDKTRRRMHIKFELKNKLLKSSLRTPYMPPLHLSLATYRKSSIPRSSSITRVVNRCTYTGRKYSTIKKFQLSRFSIRFNSYDGLLPGLRRHSW